MPISNTTKNMIREKLIDLQSHKQIIQRQITVLQNQIDVLDIELKDKKDKIDNFQIDLNL